ncbi:MAG: hypothetical protein ABIN91_11110 [Mucilaginibacter sp.]|uniref:hypothetical protein n=1 Tax=Mucilaginibacter sp. TaxID=1882438 RepID=UPI003264027E
MTVQEKILQIIRDNIPLKDGFTDQEFDMYINQVDDTYEAIIALLPSKTTISQNSMPNPNTPLWLWHKGRKEPELAVYRDDVKCFYELYESDYINNGISIALECATHFMYVNKPEDYIL